MARIEDCLLASWPVGQQGVQTPGAARSWLTPPNAQLERGKIRKPSQERLEALAQALEVTKRYILEQADMIEPVDIADPYIVELADIFADLTGEEKDEVLAGARWKAERKKVIRLGVFREWLEKP